MRRRSDDVVREQYEYAARDRATDSLIGLLALSALYGLCFIFLSTFVASLMMAVWLFWVTLGIVFSFRRPDLLRWMTFGSVGSWFAVVFVLVFNG